MRVVPIGTMTGTSAALEPERRWRHLLLQSGSLTDDVGAPHRTDRTIYNTALT